MNILIADVSAVLQELTTRDEIFAVLQELTTSDEIFEFYKS